MDFFDAVSDLKHVRLSSINVYSPEALCFFVNIYHTLLLHARIVIGPPNKQVSHTSLGFYSGSHAQILIVPGIVVVLRLGPSGFQL